MERRIDVGGLSRDDDDERNTGCLGRRLGTALFQAVGQPRDISDPIGTRYKLA